MDSIIQFFSQAWTSVVGYFVQTWKDIDRVLFQNDNWRSIYNGLGNTLLLTLYALIIGIVLGFVVAVVRVSYERLRTTPAHNRFGRALLAAADLICRVYLTIIRGTPMVVQLLIMFFVIMAGTSDKMLVSTVAFGLNSGAYVAEIFRGGVQSVDNGQFEAGRSIGFSYVGTMIYFIMPQALRSALPALCNEFIVLLKETSIVGYIGMHDLTYGSQLIRSKTYDAMIPLLAVAVVYLVLVMILTALVKRLERRLAVSEHGRQSADKGRSLRERLWKAKSA